MTDIHAPDGKRFTMCRLPITCDIELSTTGADATCGACKGALERERAHVPIPSSLLTEFGVASAALDAARDALVVAVGSFVRTWRECTKASVEDEFESLAAAHEAWTVARDRHEQIRGRPGQQAWRRVRPVKHIVAASVHRHGCFSLTPCAHCGMFGVKDGAEGCEGEARQQRVAEILAKYLSEHPLRPVYFEANVSAVDERGGMLLDLVHRDRSMRIGDCDQPPPLSVGLSTTKLGDPWAASVPVLRGVPVTAEQFARLVDWMAGPRRAFEWLGSLVEYIAGPGGTERHRKALAGDREALSVVCAEWPSTRFSPPHLRAPR